MADIIIESIKWTVQEVTSFNVCILKDERQNSQALFRSNKLIINDSSDQRIVTDFLRSRFAQRRSPLSAL